MRREYGAINWGGKMFSAHRVSWNIHFGEIPEGLWVLHKCDNGKCVNPYHLYVGTPTDNRLDMVARYRDVSATGIHPITAKLRPEQVKEIKALLIQGLSAPKIGAMYNVTRACIRGILNGKSWRHIT